MENLKRDAVTSNKLRYTLFNWILDFVTFFSKNKFNLFMRGTDFVDLFRTSFSLLSHISL